MAWRVLATAGGFWVDGSPAMARLCEAGCEVAGPPRPWRPERAALVSALQGCQAAITGGEVFDDDVFAACPELLIVSRCGVGYDSVDVEAAVRAGVVVTNTPGVMTDAVADFTMGLILAAARGVCRCDAAMHAGRNEGYRGHLLRGKTLGLLGYGAIARGVARRAAAFGMTVIAHDPYCAGRMPPAGRLVPWAELLARSDYVSLHAPATEETRHIIGEWSLARMKPTAVVVNTARGALVDEAALLRALLSGRIAGAALDVYEAEPLAPDHPLRCAPNCILAPHSAFNAAEAVDAMCLASAANVVTLMQGGRPASTVNPGVWRSPGLRCLPGERGGRMRR